MHWTHQEPDCNWWLRSQNRPHPPPPLKLEESVISLQFPWFWGGFWSSLLPRQRERERDRSLQACRLAGKIAKQKARHRFWDASRGLCKLDNKFWCPCTFMMKSFANKIGERTSRKQLLFLVQSFLAREPKYSHIVNTKVIVELPYNLQTMYSSAPEQIKYSVFFSLVPPLKVQSTKKLI